MGANAQTTVPDFVADTVLTAAKLDISAATGVPVFATTVTRDAAFGGANKVLAEGQLAYIEATDTVQYYSGAAWASVGEASKVVKMVSVMEQEVATGSTALVPDNTIPQNTEGTQFMTLAITPSNASNILVIESVFLGAPSGSCAISTALFVGSTADALAAVVVGITAANLLVTIPLTHSVVAGVTTELTFKIRAGGDGGQTITFNGSDGVRKFGAISKSSMTITEFTP